MSTDKNYTKIDPEKAKELLKSGKARPTSDNYLFDVPSILFSFLAFVVIVIITYTIIELFVDTTVVPPYVPESLNEYPLSNFNQEYKQINDLLEKQDYTSADNLIESILDDVSYEEKKALLLLQVELRLTLKQYEFAVSLARSIQSEYGNEPKLLAQLFWYRAHARYYQEEYIIAHQLFSSVALITDSKYAETSAEYAESILELLHIE